MESDDPTVVRVLAVTVDDVVAALEANERRDADAVLRATPPFSGRMRARLHIEGKEGEYDRPTPIHVAPLKLLEEVPSFPSPDDTEDELRSDPATAYTHERHRKRHERRVQCWRAAIRNSLVERCTIETAKEPIDVDIVALG
ncbi:MAG: hypothetical protein ACOCQ7_00045 [Natronomonas sp.]